ncbi:MAG: efflux RND transporter periplasmic adaptor subunit [Cognaticolwellia sp.]
MFIAPRRKSLFTSFGFTLAFTLMVTLLSACSKPKQAIKATVDYHHSADIQTISPSESYQIVREYVGKITSKQLSSLSFEYAGKVAKVYVDSGDIVTKGQVLAEFDIELLTIKQQETAANIHQLNAQAELNRLNLARINKLNTKGYSSKQALDELEAEKKIIAADLSHQQATIATVKYQISQAKLHAPFDAVISNRAVAEGENFNPNQTAFEIINQSHHEVTVGVPVKVASQLTIGQTLGVALNAQTLEAKILVIGKQVNAVSRTVELRLALAHRADFFNDQLVQVKIAQTIEQAGFWLPLSALTDGIRGQWNVYQVAEQANDLFAISATTVAVQYTTLDAAYITGLPLETQEIIASGVHRYVPKQLVKRANTRVNKIANTGTAL